MSEENATPPAAPTGPDQGGATGGTPAAAAPAAPEGSKAPESKAEGETKPDAKAPPSILGDGEPEGDGEGQKAEGEGEEKPEGGEFKIEVPEGVTVDPKLLERFAEVAQTDKVKLSAEGASELLKWFATEQRTVDQEAFAKQSAKWFDELKADPEFGGEKLKATTAEVDRFMRKHGSPELRAEARKMGLENWPELMRALARAGRSLKEDNSGGGGTPPPAPVSEQERWNRLYSSP